MIGWFAVAGSSASAQSSPTLDPSRDIILVHGLFGDAVDTWKEMRARLNSEGMHVAAIDFEADPITNSNEAPIEQQAQALAALIRKSTVDSVTPAGSVSLVCHSLGGLAARYYLEHSELWPSPKYCGVSKLIMLGTPNWGTDIQLQNPVISIVTAMASGRHGHHNVDRMDSWSTPFKQMFAEWQPAPAVDAAGKFSYPANYKLGYWWNTRIGTAKPAQYRSPMNIGRFRNETVWRAAKFIADLPLVITNDADRSAVSNVVGHFANVNKRDQVHAQYYHDAARSIGVLYPSSEPTSVWGSTARYVNPFLAELNRPNTDRSGAGIYLIAGSRSELRIDEIGVRLEGPFTGVSSDGLVPVDSVLGVDPISGQSVFATLRGQRVLNVNHTSLTHDPITIDIVVQWLKER